MSVKRRAFIIFTVAVALAATVTAVVRKFRPLDSSHPIVSIAPSHPAAHSLASRPTSQSAPPADYMDLVRRALPDFPTTKPLPVPLPLSEAARLLLPDPMYLDAAGELWVTRPDARPLADVLKKANDEPIHVVRERILFVHRRINDSGSSQPQVAVRQSSGSVVLFSSEGSLPLSDDPTAQWDRATDWNTSEVQGFILPTDDGVTIVRPRSLPVESHVSFDLHANSKPVTLLDPRGLLAWIPSENGRAGSAGAKRFVDGTWHSLGIAENWPARIVQLVPLLDGTVLQLITQDDQTIDVHMAKLDSIPIDATSVQPLIDQLSDPDPATRDTASAKLSRYGPAIWPILEKASADQSPEGQSRIERLLSQRDHPTLGLMTLLPGTADMLGRFADGGALLRSTAGVQLPPNHPDAEPTVITPATVLFDPGKPVTLANPYLTADLAADAAIDRAPDEWVVTDAASGPRRLLGNHLELLLKPSERMYSHFIGVDARGRWLFRKPQTLAPTLVLDPTLPDASPKLAVWIDPVKGDAAGWDDEGWPVSIRGGAAWALHADDWSAVAKNSETKTHTAPDVLVNTPATTQADRVLLSDGNARYFDGLTELNVQRGNSGIRHWPLPPEAVGSGAAWLIRSSDKHLYLFNEPGRVVRLSERDAGEPFKVDAIFTRQIPNTAILTRVWLDPAGRIDMVYDGSHLAVLFPDGRIPQSIAEKMPADQVNADRAP